MPDRFPVSRDGENTPGKHRGLKEPWKPGQSGNPAGKPKGSRTKLGEEFIEALHDDFVENGASAIQQMRMEDPSGYVRVCAGILPKELKIERVDELTDDQLDERIRQLASVIGIEIGDGTAPRGEETPVRH